MRLYIRLLLSISLLWAGKAQSQFVSQWSLDALRVGFDPIKSGSMFFNPGKYRDRPLFFNHTDGYLELLLHLRTSAVIEGGYTSIYLNRYHNTFFYNNKGTFLRMGLDFNVSEPDPDYEVDIGWRLGINSFKESAQLVLDGEYWNSHIDQMLINTTGGFTYWGEMLLDLKYRVFKDSENAFFKNLWFHASFRLKFKQSDLKAETYEQYYYLPGYGINSRFMGGVNFTLSYFIKIRERKVYHLHHIYDSKVLLKKGR